jgi:hypothetical protein
MTAVGQGPLNYQWHFYGTNLVNATNNWLALTNVQLGQSGPYSVSVSNTLGGVTSSDMMLSVVPFFVFGPQNQFAYVGGSAAFDLSITGEAPFDYQWHFFNTNLLSATNNLLTLTNVQFSDAGLYSVTISNAFGAILTSNAVLTVVPILIGVQPQDKIAFLGQTIDFNVSAQAKLPLSYQWQLNGADISGATNSNLTISNCQYFQSGAYRVLITDGLNATNSFEAKLSIVPVAAWGDNREGETTVPVTLSNVTAISSSSSHNLALKADGTVVSWGTAPAIPSELSNVVQLTAGRHHDLALKSDGTIVAWGTNDHGQINVPTDLTNALAVAARRSYSLALRRDRTVIGWGDNSDGQLNIPADLTNVIGICAGDGHSLALKDNGTVVAWGYNGNGQTNVPINLTNVVAIAGGDFHSLALTANGQVVTWGDTENGITNIPTAATNIVAIAAGIDHCLAVRSDGAVFAWGGSVYGQTNVPKGLVNVIAVSAGSSHSVALIMDGTPINQTSLLNPKWSPGGFHVSLGTRSGRVYLLEFKDALTDSNWFGLPLAAGTGGMITLIDPTATGSRRYYRVRQW